MSVIDSERAERCNFLGLISVMRSLHGVLGRKRPTETGGSGAHGKQQGGAVAGFHWVRERVLPSRGRTSSRPTTQTPGESTAAGAVGMTLGFSNTASG